MHPFAQQDNLVETHEFMSNTVLGLEVGFNTHLGNMLSDTCAWGSCSGCMILRST